MEQLDLTGGSHILGVTRRQQDALGYIEAQGGVTLDELGAYMHQRQGKHNADYRCAWCGDTGSGVANELHRKGLVRRRRGGRWESTRPLEEGAPRVCGGSAPASSSSGGYDPETAQIPF